jgi:inorganic pyrophosphatase/exopolyphosphatase
MTESSLKICLGNTSADMDSVVGSMALSYYYYLKDNSRLYVPIINSKRAEFYLKLEQVEHFKNC